MLEQPVGKKLYDYQKTALNRIFDKLATNTEQYNLLFQLPTGGGKTVIFSEIARRYIKQTGKKVLILTHRIELCGQTSGMLDVFDVKNKVITSEVKELSDQGDYACFVAMVETLNNRLNEGAFELENVGLVIIDEAHYNSFGKLFKFFRENIILGVTATPLSSNASLPMNDSYQELIVGESIPSLVEMGYLSRAAMHAYDINLSSLNIGMNGDYTVRSSEELYTDANMQNRLLGAYEDHCKGKKTLIFNNGIKSSNHVWDTFEKAGYPVRHLDNKNTAVERKEVLRWFKETPDAILTSVGILTTGFDEPTVESIILNRATRSLTLYFQMIGRGSRVLPSKKSFKVIDLGNNIARFGPWDAYVNWDHIFRHPDMHLNNIRPDVEIQREFRYKMPAEIRERFAKSEDIDFDVRKTHEEVLKQAQRPMVVIDQSIEQHVNICMENSTTLDGSRELSRLLHDEIAYRARKYGECLSKSTPSYVKWLQDEYKRKLNVRLIQLYQLQEVDE